MCWQVILSFWATVCKTVAQKDNITCQHIGYLATCCYRTVVLSVCLSVCDVGVLWPNGWMDQDETWHAGRPRTRPHCIRRAPICPLPIKGDGAPPPIFGPYLLWPSGWMDHDATRYGGRTRPRPLCVRWGPSSPSAKRGQSPSPVLRVEVENFEIRPEVRDTSGYS